MEKVGLRLQGIENSDSSLSDITAFSRLSDKSNWRFSSSTFSIVRPPPGPGSSEISPRLASSRNILRDWKCQLVLLH